MTHITNNPLARPRGHQTRYHDTYEPSSRESPRQTKPRLCRARRPSSCQHHRNTYPEAPASQSFPRAYVAQDAYVDQRCGPSRQNHDSRQRSAQTMKMASDRIIHTDTSLELRILIFWIGTKRQRILAKAFFATAALPRSFFLRLLLHGRPGCAGALPSPGALATRNARVSALVELLSESVI